MKIKAWHKLLLVSLLIAGAIFLFFNYTDYEVTIPQRKVIIPLSERYEIQSISDKYGKEIVSISTRAKNKINQKEAIVKQQFKALCNALDVQNATKITGFGYTCLEHDSKCKCY